MAGIQNTMTWPDLAAKIEAKQKEIDLFIAATMQTNRGMLFDASGAYNGHPAWAPLKLRAGMPLKDRGTLSQSIAPINNGIQPASASGSVVRFKGGIVEIGTNLAYAAMMNFGTTGLPGGKLVAKGRALKIPLPGGRSATPAAKELRKGASGSGRDKFMFRASVRIPARRFDQWSDEDKANLQEALVNKLQEFLK